MEISRMWLRFVLGALAALTVGCSSEPTEYDTPILERLSKAKDRYDDPEASYREISADPVGSAREAAASGDHRLISFVDAYLGSSMAAYYPGIRCSIPGQLSLVVTRTQWVHYTSDVPTPSPPPQPDVAIAESFNREMLRQPTFPYGDLCETFETDVDPWTQTDNSYEKILVFARISDVQAVQASPNDRIAVAIRNDQAPQFESNEDVELADSFGLTPLSWAAMRGSSELVDELLARGADPWAGVRCYNPSQHPAREGYDPDLPGYDDRFLTPIVLAAAAERQDLIDRMLDAVPHKQCEDTPDGGTAADAELRIMKDTMARLGNAHAARLRVFRHALMEPYKPTNEYSKNDPYRQLVDLAEQYQFRSEFRNLSDTDANTSRAALTRMAARSDLRELVYWFDRLEVEDDEEIAEMLDTTARFHTWCLGSECEDESMAMFYWLLDQIGQPSEEQNRVVILELFGSNLGPLDTHEAALRQFVGAMVERGYDFDFEQGEGCTLLMQSLSFLRDECDRRDVSPNFTKVLIELGVNVVRPRTLEGLTPLDLARRRADRGPYPESFQPVAERLSKLGVDAKE